MDTAVGWLHSRIGIGIVTSAMASESVDRAADGGRAAVEDIGVDPRRLDIVMTQKLLDRADTVTTFEQVSGEGMPERMARHAHCQSRLRADGQATSSWWRAVPIRLLLE